MKIYDKKPDWSEAPEWASLICTPANKWNGAPRFVGKYVFFASFEEETHSFPAICDEGWKVVETREEYLAKFAKNDESGGCVELSYRDPEQWSGEGLPPVGVECQMLNANGTFIDVEIIANKDGYAFGWSRACMVYFSNQPDEFRPTRTDREKAIEFLLDPGDPCGYSYVECRDDAEAIIDAIDAGKVPGYGKLEK